MTDAEESRMDIEVSVCNTENICDGVHVTEGAMPLDNVGMALVRAVSAACLQLGIDSPAAQFSAAATTDLGGQNRDIAARLQLETINTELARRGYSMTGSLGVLQAMADLTHRAKVADALDKDFGEALAMARESYRTASLIGRDLDAHRSAGTPRTPSESEVRMIMAAVVTLGHLLYRMRRLDPEPEQADGGGTTVTLTEAVPIGGGESS